MKIPSPSQSSAMAGPSGSGSRLRTSTPVPASKCNKNSNQHQGADSDFMSFFALAPSNSFFSSPSPSPLHFVLLSQGTLGKGRLTGEPWQAVMSASYGLSPGLIATPERSSNLFAELASAEGIVEEGAILLSWSARDQPTCRLGPFDPRQPQGNPPFQFWRPKKQRARLEFLHLKKGRRRLFRFSSSAASFSVASS